MPVESLKWPAGEGQRQELADQGIPRMLIVASGAAPPTVTDHLEDWIRLPHSKADLEARMANLHARHLALDNKGPDRPVIDDDGVLRTNQGWLALSAIEVKLVSTLVDQFQTVVSRESLHAAAWPNQEVSKNLLHVCLHKLRPRITSVGLEINTVRKRGYLLDYGETSDIPAEQPSRSGLFSD